MAYFWKSHNLFGIQYPYQSKIKIPCFVIKKYNVYESANFSTYYNIDFKMVIASELYKIQFCAIFQVINKENRV